jgi:hypothetical protein
VEVACDVVVPESPTPSTVIGLQSAIAISSATPPVVMDAPAIVVGSLTPPVVATKLRATVVPPVAMVLQATSVEESAPVKVFIPNASNMTETNRSLLSSSLVVGVACEDLSACHFGVVDVNKLNILIVRCNASSAGGEECGEAWVQGSPHAPLRVCVWGGEGLPKLVAMLEIHWSAPWAVKERGGPAIAAVRTKSPCSVGGCRERAWSTPKALGLRWSAQLAAKDRGGSSNAMVKTMLPCDVTTRCLSLSLLRGRVAKCVKARPPEFCDALDGWMLVIDHYSCRE